MLSGPLSSDLYHMKYIEDLSRADSDGRTLLHHACIQDMPNLVQRICELNDQYFGNSTGLSFTTPYNRTIVAKLPPVLQALVPVGVPFSDSSLKKFANVVERSLS